MTDAKHTPLPWKEGHHLSCAPCDRVLVWHCDQCGLNEPAQEEESRVDAGPLADELAEAAKETPAWDDRLAWFTQWKARLENTSEAYRKAMGRK